MGSSAIPHGNGCHPARGSASEPDFEPAQSSGFQGPVRNPGRCRNPRSMTGCSASGLLAPRLCYLRRRHRGAAVAPGIADIGRDIGDLLVRQFVWRKPASIRWFGARGVVTVCAPSRMMRSVLEAIGRLQIGIAGQRRIDPRRAAAISLVAGDARARVHAFRRRSSAACGGGRQRIGLALARRQILEIDGDGADIGVAHLRGRIDARPRPSVRRHGCGRCGRSADIRRCRRRSMISARCARRHRAAAQTSPAQGRRHRRWPACRRRTRSSACGMRRNAPRPRPDRRRDSIPCSFAGRAQICRAGRTASPRPRITTR